jgi:hypothetical protein
MKLLGLLLLSLNLSNLTANEADFDRVKAGGLSDKEQYEANNFFHQGRNQEIMQEKCRQLNERLKSGQASATIKGDLKDCDQSSLDRAGQSFGGKAGETFEAMIPVVAKAYATVIGMPGMSKISAKLGKKAQSKEVAKIIKEQGEDSNLLKDKLDNKANPIEGDKELKEKKKEYEDWCAKMPVATELIAGATQMLADNKIEQTAINPNDIQRDSLYALKRSHLERKKTAQIQTAGWGATSACYIGYAAFAQAAARDWKLWLKMAASGFLTTFYGLKIKRHQAYADELDKLIAELPPKGECNPHTETHCFCAQASSKQIYPDNYRKYCLNPALAARDNPYEAAVCVDHNMNIDNDCKCRKSRSCIQDKMLMDAPVVNGLGFSQAQTALKGLNSIGSGQFGSSQLAGTDALRNAARVNELLKQKATDEGIASANGKPDQTTSQLLTTTGVPLSVARGLSGLNAAPLEQDLRNSLARDFSSPIELNYGADKKKVSYGDESFQLNKQKKDDIAPNPFANFMQKNKKNIGGDANSVEILDFHEQARKKAEISRNSSKPIFEIISHRYRSSAWKKFDLETNPINEDVKE